MRITLLTCVLLCFGSAALLAQEAPLPKPETQDLDPDAVSVRPSATSLPLPTPAPQLIPPDLLPSNERTASPVPGGSNVMTIPQLEDAFARSPVNPTAQASRLQLEWRELRNRVANNADLRAKLRVAEAAPTDLKKRKLLRAYYESYFARLGALASTPEMKAYLQNKKNEQINLLAQGRVRPVPSPLAKPRG